MSVESISTERKWATISECGRYRYDLGRRWERGSLMIWVGLNPSTADANEDDPTIRRVRWFTKREGYAGFVMLNLYAWRATDPKELNYLDLRTATGPENENTFAHWLLLATGVIVAAWGANRPFETPIDIKGMATDHGKSVWCLGTTKSGAPKHPLYLSNSTEFETWAQ